MMGGPVNDDPIFVKHGSSVLPEGEPGTGGLFVYASEFAPYRAVAQVLVEYAEQGFPVLVVDRKDDESRSVMVALAAMLGAGDPGKLSLVALKIPLLIRTAKESVEDSLSRVSVAFDSLLSGPDAHACDMGDANGVLYVMTYPNPDARVLDVGSGLKVGSSDRYVREH